MPKRNRAREADRQQVRAERERARVQALADAEAFKLDPANALDDALWTPVAACGTRHKGACCGCAPDYCCHSADGSWY